jgi:predicted AlkP superfamily phosphohydrolase/phosphomutase
MKCFALPSISHGYIRINVQGREANGIVPADEYVRFCDELTGELHGIRDARSGRPLVQRIVRTRETAFDRDAPDADLVVFYHSEPADVVETRSAGRIGPVPFARTGGHANRGFAILRSADRRVHAVLPDGHVRDLAPTMLTLLGARTPDYLDGASLFEPPRSPAAVEMQGLA